MRSRNVQLAVGSWHLDPTCSLLSPSYHFLLLHYLLVMADYFVQLSIYGTIRSLRMDKTCCLDHYVWYNSLFVCSPIPHSCVAFDLLCCQFFPSGWFIVLMPDVFDFWCGLTWTPISNTYVLFYCYCCIVEVYFLFFVVLLFLWYHGNPSKE